MEKSSKLPPLPLVLSANLLRQGGVVYFDGSGWSAKLAEAVIAQDESAARGLELIAGESDAIVIDAALVSVTIGEDGTPAPTHYREAIRASGPTIAFGERA